MALKFTGKGASRPIDAATGLPLDWAAPILLRGFSKLAGGGYSVRVSVAGKQLSIGVRYSHEDAAALYDLAVWRFAPKIARKLVLNYPEEFEYTSQDMVDRECPRINELYLDLPYLSLADEAIAERDGVESLRLRAFKGEVAAPTRNLSAFNAALAMLKGLRGSMLTHQATLTRERMGLAYLHKLSQTDTLWNALVDDLGDMGAGIQAVEQSMETQRAFYQKLADNPSNAV